MKKCTLCKKIKELADFVRNNGKGDGFACWCKLCHRKKSKAWRINNLEKSRKIVKDWRKRNPNSYRQSSLRKNYGINSADYDLLLKKQGGKCAICLTDNDYPNRKFLCVDHVKDTLKIRGLLCNRCNSAIGLLSHNIDKLKNAIKYLQRKEIFEGKKVGVGIHRNP